MYKLTCSESQLRGSRWKRNWHSNQPAMTTLACPLSHTRFLHQLFRQGGSPSWAPEVLTHVRLQLQSSRQNHWACAVHTRMHLYKAMPSRLGKATVLPNSQRQTESQSKLKDKRICAKERTIKLQGKTSIKWR